MGIAILDELQTEINRIYIAGSRLAKDDPRLKKYIPAFAGLGQKSPVFAALSKQLSELTQGEETSSAEKLLELGALIYAVQSTLAPTTKDLERQELRHESNLPLLQELRFSTLNAAINALTPGMKKHDKTIEELVAENNHDDERLYSYYVNRIGESSYVSAYVEKTVIPLIGRRIEPYLRAQTDLCGGKADAARFRTLYKMLGDEILPLSEQALAGDAKSEVYVAAIYTLWRDNKYEETLLAMAKSRKTAVRQAAFASLARLNTERAREVLLSALEKEKMGTMAEAIAASKDEQLAQRFYEKLDEIEKNAGKNTDELCDGLLAIIRRGTDGDFEKLREIYDRHIPPRPTGLARLAGNIGLKAKANALENPYFSKVFEKVLSEEISPAYPLVYELAEMCDEYSSFKILTAVKLFDGAEVYARCKADVRRQPLNMNAVVSAYCESYRDEIRPDSERNWDARWGAEAVRLNDYYAAFMLTYKSDIVTWNMLFASMVIAQKNSSRRSTALLTYYTIACKSGIACSDRVYKDVVTAFPAQKEWIDSCIAENRN